ncbi:putative Ig domain-containing protein [Agromyces sp. MMS24-K17]|uniref:putative Ig domain-containing protein n=1 Tax=Agromyces sp. MMS24-K17 TaxID=3372850 RepID=UPI003754B980
MSQRTPFRRAIRSIAGALAVAVVASAAVVATALPAQAAPVVPTTLTLARDVNAGTIPLVPDGTTSNGALYAETAPPGMALAFTPGNGIVLQGTPTVAGTYPVRFDVIWVDGGGGFQQYTVNVTVVPPAPTWSTTSPLADGRVGKSGTWAFQASDATSYALAGGALPSGLELSSAGSLTGTPSIAGDFTFTIAATGAGGTTGRPFILTVAEAAPAPVWVTTSVPDFLTGIAGSFTFVATNATTYSLSSGTLPAGLTLSGAGVLSGTPTGSGTSSATIRATNVDGVGADRPFSIRVVPPPVWVGATSMTVTVGQTLPLPGHFENISFVHDIVPPGSPYSYANGNVTGLTVGSGKLHLTGIPANSHPSLGAIIDVSVIAPPAWVTTGIPDFGVGVPGSTTLVATGAASYSVTGTLPPGVSFIAASGVLSGTPTVAGSYPVTFTATNSVGFGVDRAFTLVVQPEPTWVGPDSLLLTVGETVVLPLSVVQDGTPIAVDSEPKPGVISVELRADGIAITALSAGLGSLQVIPASPTHPNAVGFDIPVEVRNAPVWVTTSLGELRQGVAVDLDLEATDATGYALAAGSTLPAGLALAADGSLTGTPTGFGPYSFIVEATNGDEVVGQAFSGTVQAPLVEWVTEDLPLLHVGVAVDESLEASDAVAFAVTDGELPPGLDLVGDTITGTPTEAGEFEVEITASNATGEGVARTFTITVDEPVLELTLEAGPGDAAAGAVVTVTGSGLEPGAGLDVTLFSDPIVLVDVAVAADGTIDLATALPASVPFGAHELRVTTTGPDGSPVTLSIWFSVGEDGTILEVSTEGPVAEPVRATPAATPASSGLAGTGVEPGAWLALALVLGFAGAATVVGAGRVKGRGQRV